MGHGWCNIPRGLPLQGTGLGVPLGRNTQVVARQAPRILRAVTNRWALRAAHKKARMGTSGLCNEPNIRVPQEVQKRGHGFILTSLSAHCWNSRRAAISRHTVHRLVCGDGGFLRFAPRLLAGLLGGDGLGLLVLAAKFDERVRIGELPLLRPLPIIFQHPHQQVSLHPAFPETGDTTKAVQCLPDLVVAVVPDSGLDPLFPRIKGFGGHTPCPAGFEFLVGLVLVPAFAVGHHQLVASEGRTAGADLCQLFQLVHQTTPFGCQQPPVYWGFFVGLVLPHHQLGVGLAFLLGAEPLYFCPPCVVSVEEFKSQAFHFGGGDFPRNPMVIAVADEVQQAPHQVGFVGDDQVHGLCQCPSLVGCFYLRYGNLAWHPVRMP